MRELYAWHSIEKEGEGRKGKEGRKEEGKEGRKERGEEGKERGWDGKAWIVGMLI